MNNKPEILAPAGSMESLIAAVRCGANAVYLGTKGINARRGATNFTFEELKQAVEYCHARDVKIYLALNILISDSERELAYKTVEAGLSLGVDAFIIQDLGLAKIIHSHFPTARMHASTQCSVNSPEGFKALEKMGFVRAVLPREMSLDEIKEIRQATNMELEMFVHGALCMCVSGQCYLSAMLGGRSGNRGLCAQPCRLGFSADASRSCDLSLKDLSLIGNINEIAQAGVVSLKIEGRMKRPEYVAAAVSSCKKAIDGEYSASDENTLKSVFSRTGFTDGYFTGERKDMFGTRQKEDVVAAKDVLKELSHLYDNENPLVPIDIEFICKANHKAELTATALGKTVTVTGTVPEKAINKPMTEESVETRLAKFGNTQFYLNNITIDLDDGLILPASVINSMRREAVKMLDKVEIQPFTQMPYKAEKYKEKDCTPYYTARFLNPDSIPDKHPFKRIFIPIWSSDEDFVDNRAGVEVPRGLFGMEEKLTKRLEHLKKIGVRKALCSNLGAYSLAQKMGFEVYGDFGLNIFNSESAQLFNSPILSFEATLEQTNRIGAKDTGIIGYGYLPLMLTRNCPIKNHLGCSRCTGKLTDRKGFEFRVKCSPYPCVEVLNPVPVYMGDRQKEIKTDFIHFYFTDESKNQVEQIINLFKTGGQFDGKYTRGLTYRGVE
ncbi:MAG: U32 family peptidase [Eubacterium coprostanoligenes]|uniref:U32 family peptidase n=1 Tax=Eubacterium coprostanoligenes TaxID=290054 RepID=UPI002A912E7D|nr:U32 family peptidase [Eubacterium coprostanoligenes]MDY5399876.1 U32 family peptidase [Eubacterium coprostanoligenes]